MQPLFRSRRDRLDRLRRQREQAVEAAAKRSDVPAGGSQTCPGCGRECQNQELVKTEYVCPHCGYHLPIGAYLRLSLLLDPFTFQELWPSLTAPNALEFPGYEQKLAAQRAAAEQAAAEREASTALDSGVAKAGNKKHSVSGVIVSGMTECMVKFAKCCTPVPGDPIVGFITRGYGVSVHRADCPNAVTGMQHPQEKDRWIKVSWDPDSLNTYKTSLDLIAKDRPGLAMDITTVMASSKINILGMNVNVLPDGYAKMNLVVEVRAQSEVTTIMNKLNQVRGVYQVSRVSG